MKKILTHALLGTLACAMLTGTTLSAKKKTNHVDEVAEMLFANPEFDSPKLSPDGSHILMYAFSGDSKDLGSYNLETKIGVRFGAGNNFGFRGAFWIDNDQLFARKIKWGTYYDSAWVIDESLPDESFPIGVERDVGGTYYRHSATSSIGFHMFSLFDSLSFTPDKAILLDSYHSTEGYLDLWEVSKNGRKVDRLTRSADHIIDAAFDLQGNMRIMTVKGEKANQRIYYHRWDDDSEWEALPFENKEFFLGFDPSGKVVYMVHEPEERQVTQAFDLETKEYLGRPISNPDYGVVANIIRMPGSGDPIGFTYNADTPKVFYFEPNLRTVMKTVQDTLPDMIHIFMGFRGSDSIIFKSFSDRQPTIIHDLNIKEKHLSRVLEEYPDIDANKMASMTPFTCETRDGDKIHGYYTLPPAHVAKRKKKFPTIVMVHGGPHARDYWGFDPEVQFYAQLGYAVLQVNYRGSSQLYQEHIYNLVECCKYAVDDVADATQWFIDQGFADKKHIGIYGWSFGGYTALASAARYPHLYNCAMGAGGVYDWQNLIKNEREDFSHMMEWGTDFWGDIDEEWDNYALYSPINQVDKIKIPVYLLHGNADGVVGASQSKKMYSALKKAGVDVKLDTPSWVGHGLYKDEHRRLKYVRRIYDFLAENI